MSLSEAHEALAHWGGSACPPQPLRERENAVYRVRLPSGPAALRLHRRGYQTAAAIASELWWCAALADAGLPVPRPVRSRDEALVVRLEAGRLASAIGWIEGGPIGEAGTQLAGDLTAQTRLMRDLGVLVAQVHSATDRLVLPKGFVRHRWDSAGLVGESPLWGRFWTHPALGVEEAAMLRSVRGWLAEALTRGTDFGLIHADVLRENVLATPAGLALIDFDDAGFGYRLYDLGTALSQCLDAPGFEAMSEAILAGYGLHRALAADAVDQVAAFTLMRACASVGWLATRAPPDHPRTRPYIDRALRCARRLGAV
jgi:Ser/Thr protein kinase RdoA (MazF antagonist)